VVSIIEQRPGGGGRKREGKKGREEGGRSDLYFLSIGEPSLAMWASPSREGKERRKKKKKKKRDIFPLLFFKCGLNGEEKKEEGGEKKACPIL